MIWKHCSPISETGRALWPTGLPTILRSTHERSPDFVRDLVAALIVRNRGRVDGGLPQIKYTRPSTPANDNRPPR